MTTDNVEQNNNTKGVDAFRAAFVESVKRYLVRFLGAFIFLLLLGKMFTAIMVEEKSNRALNFRGSLWILPLCFFIFLIFYPILKKVNHDPVGYIRKKLENSPVGIRSLYNYRFSIIVFHPFCCWITRGVIGACGYLTGKKTFDVRQFGTKIEYSYIFDKKYILLYFVGSIILSLMIGFVISNTYLLIKPYIQIILNKVGIHTERITVNNQYTAFWNIFCCVLFSVGIIITISTIWLFKTWTNLNIYELIYTMTSPIEGTNPQMVRDYILKYGTIEAGAIVAIIVVMFLIRRKKKASKVIRIAIGCLGVMLLGGSFVYANKRLGIIKYIKNMNSDSSFAREIFVNPKSVKMKFPEKKRNLIYIYLESFEMTYADEESGGAFYKNVIPELTGLAEEGETFSGDPKVLNGGISTDGTTWTIGAIFGQSSGVPMLLNMSTAAFDTQDSFCEGITTIGDILEDNGYKNVFMIGSDAAFGGRDTFYKTHGNYEICDYDYAIDEGWIPEDYKVWWGYEDEKLFAFAKNKLDELAAGDQPFNLTLLTVDTHFEDGYVCDLCGDEFGYNQYANVFHCSDKQVYEFVKWIMEQDWYEDTVIVLCGDHPTMDSDFCDNVDGSYQRRVYTNFINSSVEYKGGARTYTTLDMFPTTLAAMGVTIEGDRLAWGTNLFSDTATYTEMYGYNSLNQNLQQGKKFIEELASFEISDALLEKVRSSFRLEKHDSGDGTVRLMADIGEVIHGDFIDYYEIDYKKDGGAEVLRSEMEIEGTDTKHCFIIDSNQYSEIGQADVYIVVKGERYQVKEKEAFD